MNFMGSLEEEQYVTSNSTIIHAIFNHTGTGRVFHVILDTMHPKLYYILCNILGVCVSVALF
jgi:fructose-specific phosphotransferase system IIC component